MALGKGEKIYSLVESQVSHMTLILLLSLCYELLLSTNFTGNRNISLRIPGVIREGFRGEMRMAYLAHSVRNNGVQYTTVTLEMT